MSRLNREITPQGESEHSPREIAARGVHKVVTQKIISPREIGVRAVLQVSTEEIISRGESPRLPRSIALNAANDALVIDSGSYKGIVFAA